jgi:release factor glutamine methyltransferase
MTRWRELRAEVARRVGEHEARFLVEEASGYSSTDWFDIADVDAPARAAARLDAMVERRLAGEPLQYVLGAWAFRGLDLMVDPRVLIPRPETERVVEVALEEAVRLGLRRGRPRRIAAPASAFVADLGTGSGAIALGLAAELPDVEVWATDASDDALAVARANVAGTGSTRVRLAKGSWFDALPEGMRGAFQLIVSNPPYVAEYEVADLPAEVAGHEPGSALVAGPTGLEALVHIISAASAWLETSGTLVCEIAPQQADAVRALATEAGFTDVSVRDDLTQCPRVLVARRV